MSLRFLRSLKVPNNAFASSFVLKSEKLQRKCINYCSKHTVKMQWIVHTCLTGSVNLKKGCQVRSKTKVMLLAFFDSEGIVHHEYAPEGQTTKNSTWRSCDACVNQFSVNDRKNGGMATGSCTMTMRPHTRHISCSSFWPNTVPLSCSSRHTHQILHCVTFTYSQGLRKF